MIYIIILGSIIPFYPP